MATHVETSDVLEIRDAHGTSVHHPLDGTRVILGRSADADIKLATATVSRRHAELSRDPFQRWWLRDLDSHNGTYVNDQPITESVLHPGDTARIGEFTLQLLPTEPSADDAPDAAELNATQHGEMTIASTHEDVGSVSALRQIEPDHVATEHLAQLARFGDHLIATSDPEQRLVALCQLVVGEQFHGQSALVLRLDREADPSEPRVLCPVQHRENADEDAPHISRTLLRAVLAAGEAMMATNTRPDATGTGDDTANPSAGAIELSISPDVMPMAAIACPLRRDEQLMDVLYTTLPPTYARGEWLALMSLAVRQYEQAELAWAGRRQAEALAAIERELEQAHEIQMRLVPRKRTIPQLDTAIAFEPCRWVGGDYADVLRLQDGRTLLTVADVCGKGMQAALTTASIHTMVHASVRAGTSLVEMMRHLNEHLLEVLPDSSFVTMACLAIEPASGALECVNAGHPPALVVDGGGALRELQQAKNLPLGIAPDEPEPEPGQLAVGEWVALYSDGLTELGDEHGAMIGIEGLGKHFAAACVAADAQASEDPAGHAPPGGAEHVTTALLEHARSVRGERMAEDDWTLLVARRTA